MPAAELCSRSLLCVFTELAVGPLLTGYSDSTANATGGLVNYGEWLMVKRRALTSSRTPDSVKTTSSLLQSARHVVTNLLLKLSPAEPAAERAYNSLTGIMSG